MTDLDLALRTPGRILLLKRGEAQALLDRVLEGRRERSGNWLSSMLGGITGRTAQRDDEEKPAEAVAMPSVRWASDVVYGEGYALVEGVAIIDITGVLTPEGYFDWWSWEWVPGYAQIAEAIEAARDDGRVKAVFLRGNSPGGLVDGCFDAADQIRLRNGNAGGKPVWAHVRMACSAAYALVSGADRIFASEESDVGSIGVVITHVDSSAMLEEWGLKVEAIESAPHKTDGAGWKPLSEEARGHLKAVVDQVAKRFVSVVSEGRGLTEDAIRAQEARWYLAQHDDPNLSGLALGLVDEIGSERAAFAALLASLTDTPETTTEIEMALKDQVSALRAKASAGDAKALAELKALGIPVSAEKAEDEGGDDGDDTKAEGEEDDETEEDEGGEPKAGATGTRAGFALVGSKSAKGREALAAKLGEKVATGSMTYGEAMGMLGAAPKASSLSAAMAGRDRNIGGSDPNAEKSGSGLLAAIDRRNAKHGGKSK